MRLFPFQEEAVEWLSSRPKAILALEQGLGKTVVAACDLQPPATVFSTAAMKHRWALELSKWRPELKSQVLSAQQEIPYKCDPDADVFILSFDVSHKVKLRKPKTLIVDECHKIKSLEARRSRAVLAIADRVERVRYLSGTPMLSRPMELYTILSSVGAIHYKMGWKSYARRFCKGWNTPWGTFDASGASNLEDLEEIVSGYMFRKTKTSVLPDLPPKMFRIVEFEGMLDPRENGFLDYYRENLRLPENPIAFQAISDIRRMQAEAKVPEAVRYIKNLLDQGLEKVVVFAHHRDSVDRIWEALSDYGAVRIKGGTSPRDSFNYVQQFQTSDRVRVFVGNLQSSGEGVTLTRASHVVLVEPSWVPGEIQQAADRCHRIGQESSVLVDLLTVQGSIDAKMLHTALEKTEVIDQVIRETETEERVCMNTKRIAELLRELADEFDGADVSGAAAPATSGGKKTQNKPAPAAKAPKIEDVRKVTAQALAGGKRDEITALLKSHDSENLSGLEEAAYEKFIEQVNKILED